jgi:hypothetical protein
MEKILVDYGDYTGLIIDRLEQFFKKIGQSVLLYKAPLSENDEIDLFILSGRLLLNSRTLVRDKKNTEGSDRSTAIMICSDEYDLLEIEECSCLLEVDYTLSFHELTSWEIQRESVAGRILRQVLGTNLQIEKN